MSTTVVHCKKKNYDVYIGRPPRGGSVMHYGNPFGHNKESRAAYILPSRAAAINAFREWLKGTAYQDFAQERRRWILKHLEELRGKVLGCWCSPLPCHGDVLIEFLEEAK